MAHYEDRRMERLAWVTAHILNCYTPKGETITPAQLLGKPSGNPDAIEAMLGDSDATYESMMARQRELRGG